MSDADSSGPPAGVIRETDETARREARMLVRSARFAALGVIEPRTAMPFVSRVLLGTDIDAAPVTLISRLSTHTRALDADPRASLLVGEPGKGDPMAHPRLTVQCRAERIPHDSDAHVTIRRRFLRRHPKANLYVDFGDFAFFRFNPQAASLNGGFGKAYELECGDLVIDPEAARAIAAIERDVLDHMNADHPDAAGTYARALGDADGGEWHFCGLDAAGFDLQSGTRITRIEFGRTLRTAVEIRRELVALLEQARRF